MMTDILSLSGTTRFDSVLSRGLTGWAQVHGLRGETAALELMEGRIAFDIWYIKNWSIWLDLRIVIRTFFELVRARNAY